jgi:hypothetical protein
MSWARYSLAQLCQFLLFFILFHPVFFVIFRLMAFNTVPRDEYGRYLLWLLREPGGGFPGSPYGYRILSVVVGAPFYYLLPALPLTNLPPEPSANYWQATAALAMVSYLALIASAMMAYRLVVVRYGRPPLEGLIGALFLTLCAFYSQYFALDTIAFLLIVCAVYAIDRLWLFGAIVVAAVLFNEKVIIVFALWTGCRFVFASGDRAYFARRLIVVCVAVALYVAMLAILRLEGHSEQLTLSEYLPALVQNVVATFTTPRGFLLNVVPCVLVAAAVWWSWNEIGQRRYAIFARIDLMVVPALMVITLVLTQFYQVGRIVMHAAPLFVLPVSLGLGAWLRR